MKRFTLFFLMLLVFSINGFGKEKIFTRDYTYQASEDDSKNSARTQAVAQLRLTLLREIGAYMRSEQKTDNAGQNYAEKIEAITAGIVELKILDEQWNGATYYVKAEMTVDPDEVGKRIAEILDDNAKTKALEESRQRTVDAIAEADRLRKELEEQKSSATQQQKIYQQQTAETERLKKELEEQKNNADLQQAYQQQLAETERLRKELENQKNNAALQQQAYHQQIETLSAEEYLTKGNNALENKFYELAIEYYQKAVSINPNYAGAYNNMGLAYMDQNNYPQAISCYQKAISINPNDAEAYYTMGVAYYYENNYPQAISCYQKVINIRGLKADLFGNMVGLWALYEIGVSYHKQENYPQAIEYYQKAMSIDANYAIDDQKIGAALLNQKIQEVMTVDSSYSIIYNNMGKIFYNNKSTLAANYFNKAININPNLAEAYYYLGYIYTFKLICSTQMTINGKQTFDNNYTKAIGYLKKAVSLDPNYAKAYYNMGVAYYFLNNESQAVSCYQKAAQLGFEAAKEWLKKNGYSW